MNLAVPDQTEIEDVFLTFIFKDFLHSSLNGLLFRSQEKQVEERKECDAKTEGELSMVFWPVDIMETIPVRLSIYIFCADLLGPIITGI